MPFWSSRLERKVSEKLASNVAREKKSTWRKHWFIGVLDITPGSQLCFDLSRTVLGSAILYGSTLLTCFSFLHPYQGECLNLVLLSLLRRDVKVCKSRVNRPISIIFYFKHRLPLIVSVLPALEIHFIVWVLSGLVIVILTHIKRIWKRLSLDFLSYNWN